MEQLVNNENYSEIKERILELIKENTDADGIEIWDDMSLFEDLGYDSIRIITLISQIEKEFELEFEDYARLMDAVNSVESFIDYFILLIKE